jgi:hypothetical protein
MLRPVSLHLARTVGCEGAGRGGRGHRPGLAGAPGTVAAGRWPLAAAVVAGAGLFRRADHPPGPEGLAAAGARRWQHRLGATDSTRDRPVSPEPVILAGIATLIAGASGVDRWRASVRRQHTDERFLLNLQAGLLGVDHRQARSLGHLRSLVHAAPLDRDLDIEPPAERRGPWRGRPGSWRLPRLAGLPVVVPVRTAPDAAGHLEAPEPDGHDLPPLDDPLALHDRAHAAGLASHTHATTTRVDDHSQRRSPSQAGP